MEPQDPTHPFSETPPPRQEEPLNLGPSRTQQPPSPSSLQPSTAPRPAQGRPLRLTREVHDAIVSAVEQGSYLKIAAQAAGVGQSTLAGWLARGREAASLIGQHADDPDDATYCPDCGAARPMPAAEQPLVACAVCGNGEAPLAWQPPESEAPFLELLESVTRAQATAETEAVAAWKKAFTGYDPDWRAARDYLARTAPERWAGVTRVQMTTEEAERRIDDAVNEALLAIGVDLPADDADLALDEPGEVLDA